MNSRYDRTTCGHRVKGRRRVDMNSDETVKAVISKLDGPSTVTPNFPAGGGTGVIRKTFKQAPSFPGRCVCLKSM